MVAGNFICIIEVGNRQRGGEAGGLDSSGSLLHFKRESLKMCLKEKKW